MLGLLTRETYEIRRWDCLKWHDVNTKLYDDWFMHSNNSKVIISTIWQAAVFVLLMGGI
jgi:hypothetical protein